MPNPHQRRRILCVRPRPNPRTAAFLAAIKTEWIEALSLHAEVYAIEEDFDLREVCDRVRPDLIIFEMISWPRPVPLEIAEADAHPAIPRAAIFNGDPHEPMRALFLRLLDHYGVTTIFGYGLHHHQHMPGFGGIRCYAVPIFVDCAVFHDYGLEKTIPVSVFGGHMAPSFYPWRARVVAEVQHRFPTLVYPHPGYHENQGDAFAVRGTAYARLINQSHYSVADTTRLDYVVRKHLEIPGAGAILVAPNSAALKDYGFVDMANCILGSPPEVYDKIAAVSRDEALGRSIGRAGYDLVQSRYTRQSWTCILDWFECQNAVRPGDVVQQQGAMGPFRAVAEGLGRAAVAGTIRPSPLSAVLGQARDAILSGRGIDQAHAALRDASTWSSNIAEPVFLLGILALLRAQPMEAAVSIAQRAEELRKIDLSLARLDPCEIAWLLLIAHLLGHGPLAETMHQQAVEIPHLALRRITWLLDQGRGWTDDLETRIEGDCLSVHWLGEEAFAPWSGLMGRVLLANGEVGLHAELQHRLRRCGAVADLDVLQSA